MCTYVLEGARPIAPEYSSNNLQRTQVLRPRTRFQAKARASSGSGQSDQGKPRNIVRLVSYIQPLVYLNIDDLHTV